jgi:RimJ/RimL family protein N-acetyltransferase
MAHANRVADTESVDQLRTERLLLRQWQRGDEAEMVRINRDPAVGRYLNRPVDDAALAHFYRQMTSHWDTHGYGPWAVQSLEAGTQGRFLGFTGLAHVPPFLAAAGPGPELGWRLDPAVWGRGLATEAALAARDDAIARVGPGGVISIIHPDNVRSRRVATKIGMHLQRQVLNPVLGIEVGVWRFDADEATRGADDRPA